MLGKERFRHYLSVLVKDERILHTLTEALKLERVQLRGEEVGLFTQEVERLQASPATLQSATLDSLEAIIRADIRPAIDIQNNRFEAGEGMWQHLDEDEAIRGHLERAIPAIGRIELQSDQGANFIGTGVVIGEGLLMTNRHVAEVFTRGVGDQRVRFKQDADPCINFRRELDGAEAPSWAIRNVRMIHPYWDMALLELDSAGGIKPLALSVQDARQLAGREIAVIGYPARDPRNPLDVQNTLFRQRYGVKRLQPGQLHQARETASFGKRVRAAAHDCSTLGGNSGSAIIDLRTGQVLGLHFGGAYLDMNWAVPSFALAADQRVVDAGVRLGGLAPSPTEAWAAWWRKADAEIESIKVDRSAFSRPAPPPEPKVPVPGANLALRAAAIEIAINIVVDVSVAASSSGQDGTLVPATNSVATSNALSFQETLVEPYHDTDYQGRRGFDKAFLGGGDLIVGLPKVDKAIVAPTLSGAPILHYENFSIVMHHTRRLAIYTASNVTKEQALRASAAGLDRDALAGLGENDLEKWFLDPRMDARYQLPDKFYTKDRQAFDKGHIVRREDVAWGAAFDNLLRANGDTYHVTNCSPQTKEFNRFGLGPDNWGDLENLVLRSSESERLSVFAGPVFSSKDPVFHGMGDAGPVSVQIPKRYWKLIVSRDELGLAAHAFVLKQDLGAVKFKEFAVPAEFQPALIAIAELEELTGLQFTEAVRQADRSDTGLLNEISLQPPVLAFGEDVAA